jgi:hypothetical protein
MALYYDLPVFKDVYKLILKIFDYTKDFSKEYKFTLRQDMQSLKINLKLSLLMLFILSVLSNLLMAQGIIIKNGTTITGGSATITLSGNWSNSGTFTAGTSTVLFNGASGNQTITNSSEETFNNLTVNKAGGDVQLSNNITVNGTLTLTSGDVDLNDKTITLGSSATLSETTGNTVKGITGIITTTRLINARSSNNIGGMGAELTSSAALGSTIITRGHTAQTGSGNTGIKRYFNITPTNNSNLNATFVFHYDDSELNALTESELILFKSTDIGINWTQMDGTVNTTNNTVTLVGLDGFSRWTLGASSLPLPVEEEIEVEIIPTEFALNQNYPNPFNPVTTIKYGVREISFVELRIYDVLGKEVYVLVNEEHNAGFHKVNFNAERLASGIYFYRLQAGYFVETKKMILLR